ncbi:MAG: hypothetical protein ABW321_30250 [Polyangiales bacterium]
MWRFLAGFGTASLLWGALVLASKQGWIDISLAPEAPPGDETNLGDTSQDDTPDKPVRARKKRVASQAKHAHASSNAQTSVGDDLRENEAKNLNVGANGGEEQLRGTEIEQAFDAGFGQIRRCLILAADDEPASGKLVFGLRITGAGKVSAVNLTGPASVAKGEAGACLRKAASGLHFRSFNGPDMVVHYPITLE